MITRGELLATVDHTLLAAEATRDQIVETAEYGASSGVTAVCVNGRWTDLVAEILQGTPVKTCVVVGFPLGASGRASKVQEAATALEAGADEIDVVWDLGGFLGGDRVGVADELAAVRAAIPSDQVLKVILETAVLAPVDIAEACRLAVDAGADFVKTSTGFHKAGGASVDAVTAMRTAVGDQVGVKASGGIRTLDAAEQMVRAGASRLGLSGTSAILAEIDARPA